MWPPVWCSHLLGDARTPRAHGGLRSMIAEKQTITINVLDHETPDTIITSVRYGHRDDNAARCELRCQRVRIRHFQISIPTKRRFTAVVRDRLDGDLFAVGEYAERLEHDRRPIAADNPEKLVI